MLILFLAKATKQRLVTDKTVAKLKTLTEIVVCRCLRVGLGICIVSRLGWLESLGVPWMLLRGAVVMLLGGRWGYLGAVVHLFLHFPPVLS